MNIAVIIPARYASTRFPGKPLALISGRSMLARVVDIGRASVRDEPDVDLMVATDDIRIAEHAAEIGVSCVMTPAECRTGSERVLAAAQASERASGRIYDFLISLQGDAPAMPPEAPGAVIRAAREKPEAPVITPVIRLSWAALDALREAKRRTPFSGTTCVVGADGRALWFSKQILPAIRKESERREKDGLSPVCQHVGLYGYRTQVLERFAALPPGYYEALEGLEQLRFLENGIAVHTVAVPGDPARLQAGVDSPEDIKRIEAYFK